MMHLPLEGFRSLCSTLALCMYFSEHNSSRSNSTVYYILKVIQAGRRQQVYNLNNVLMIEVPQQPYLSHYALSIYQIFKCTRNLLDGHLQCRRGKERKERFAERFAECFETRFENNSKKLVRAVGSD
eukprot:3941-Heterococcus_DN1.PRE.1